MTDEQFQLEMNQRMDYLIQQILTLKKRVDIFMDEIELKNNGIITKRPTFIENPKKEITRFPPPRTKRPGFVVPKITVTDQDGGTQNVRI